MTVKVEESVVVGEDQESALSMEPIIEYNPEPMPSGPFIEDDPTVASVAVGDDWDLGIIVKASGQPDAGQTLQKNGRLYVRGVTQAQLDSALAAYDHEAVKRARAVKEVNVERDRLLAIADNETFGMSDAFLAGLLTEEEEEKFRKWAAYKLGLRRITSQAEYPFKVTWPSLPK